MISIPESSLRLDDTWSKITLDVYISSPKACLRCHQTPQGECMERGPGITVETEWRQAIPEVTSQGSFSNYLTPILSTALLNFRFFIYVYHIQNCIIYIFGQFIIQLNIIKILNKIFFLPLSSKTVDQWISSEFGQTWRRSPSWIKIQPLICWSHRNWLIRRWSNTDISSGSR